MHLTMKDTLAINYVILNTQGLRGDICRRLIFDATSDKKAFKLVFDACLGLPVWSLDLAEYAITLASNNPIFKMIEAAMNKEIDKRMES